MQIMDVFLSMFLDGYLPIGRLDNIVGKSRLWLHTVVTQVVHLIICYSSLFLILMVAVGICIVAQAVAPIRECQRATAAASKKRARRQKQTMV